MYGKKSYKKPYRKTYKKGKNSSKKYKRIFKSTTQHTKVSPMTVAKETYVKLPYVITYQTAIAAGIGAGYTLLGNSLLPTPQNLSTGAVTAGDIWVSGVKEYSDFYNFYRVLGSKISIQVTAVSANNVFRCALVPVAYGGPETGPQSEIFNKVAELNTLTFDQLCMQPYAQTKILGIASGGNATTYFKMFRKTKNMLSVKDIRDDQDGIMRVPDYSGIGGSYPSNANNSFAYFFKVFNTAGAVQTVEVHVKMTYYTMFSGRNRTESLVSTGPWT